MDCHSVDVYHKFYARPCLLNLFAKRDYFCEEMENILYFRFGLKDAMDAIGTTSSIQKEMLRSAITAASHIAYLNACIRIVNEKNEEQEDDM